MAAFPMMPGGGAPTPGATPDLSALLGAEAQTQAPQAQPQAEDVARNTLREFHDLHNRIDALARQWPEAAEEAREAKQFLTRMMVKVVASQRAPEMRAPAPAVFG